MKRLLVILGLFIALAGIKAVAWVAQHGAPRSLLPATVPDMIGFGFVVALVLAFLAGLVVYLAKRR